MLFGHDFSSLYHRLGRRVVAPDGADLIGVQIRVIYAGHLKSLARCHECIFGLFRQPYTGAAVKKPFQHRTFHNPGKSRLVSIVKPSLLYSYPGAAFA